jgi:hypothetical protein
MDSDDDDNEAVPVSWRNGEDTDWTIVLGSHSFSAHMVQRTHTMRIKAFLKAFLPLIFQ